MSFPCTSCGLCCKKVGQTVAIAKQIKAIHDEVNAVTLEVANFPYGFDETGACEMLDENNRCKVYDHRPDICSIEKTWANHYSDSESIEGYYSRSITACNALILSNGLHPKFLIQYEYRQEIIADRGE